MSTISFKKLQRFTTVQAKFHLRRRQGDYTSIANRTGYSPGHVWNVLNNKRAMNEEVFQCANELIASR